MKVTMLLADSAQAVGGKLYILGGGWSLTGPAVPPMALAIKIDLPWDRANLKHKWRLELVDADGHPVKIDVPGEDEQKPLMLEGEIEVGRPPGLKAGSPLDVPMAFSFGPLPLRPDMRYEWRFFIEKLDEGPWTVPFTTRPQLPAALRRPEDR